MRRLNSGLGVVQLPGVNENRGLPYVGPDVYRIVTKGALHTFLGLFEVPHVHGGVAEEDVRERVVGLGGQSDEQAFSRFFQHANVTENQSLPDARGMAARIETEGRGESAQSRAILKFSCGRPEDAAFRAVCLRIIGVQRDRFAQSFLCVAHPVWRGARSGSH